MTLAGAPLINSTFSYLAEASETPTTRPSFRKGHPINVLFPSNLCAMSAVGAEEKGVFDVNNEGLVSRFLAVDVYTVVDDDRS